MHHELSLDVVGAFTVCRRGSALPAIQVGTRKARTLLALLAVNRGRMPSIERVTDALWGQNPPRRPAQDVATIVSRLRATLGPHVVLGGRAGYQLGPHIRVDLFDAGELVEMAEYECDSERALRCAQRALGDLDKGEVLDGWPDLNWTAHAGRLHQTFLRRARHAVAEAALRLGAVHVARDAAESAMAADPFDEIACRALMRAHYEAGESARALLVYERLRTTLTTELGADPGVQTQQLHVVVLRNSGPHLAVRLREIERLSRHNPVPS
jgi:DNA-binding SARP family transcriptional activator